MARARPAFSSSSPVCCGPFMAKSPSAAGRSGLATGQQAHLIGHGLALRSGLTVEENLAFWTSFLGGGNVASGLEAFGLDQLAHLPAGVLSAGQQRRLSLARLAAVGRPIWLLDEPSVGLDRTSLKQLNFQMGNHLSGGGIIIAASHGDFDITCTPPHRAWRRELNAVTALIGRDLKTVLRQGSSAGTAMGFFLAVVLLLPLGLGPDQALLARIAPGGLWVALLHVGAAGGGRDLSVGL